MGEMVVEAFTCMVNMKKEKFKVKQSVLTWDERKHNFANPDLRLVYHPNLNGHPQVLRFFSVNKSEWEQCHEVISQL